MISTRFRVGSRRQQGELDGAEDDSEEVRIVRMVRRMRMRMASRWLKECESQACGKKQLWPFPPTGNFGTKDTFIASPIPQLLLLLNDQEQHYKLSMYIFEISELVY